MLINKEIIEKQMEKESLQTIKEVLIFTYISLGRTVLNWRPRRLGGGKG